MCTYVVRPVVTAIMPAAFVGSKAVCTLMFIPEASTAAMSLDFC